MASSVVSVCVLVVLGIEVLAATVIWKIWAGTASGLALYTSSRVVATIMITVGALLPIVFPLAVAVLRP